MADSTNNSTVLTPEVKQVAQYLQHGDPRRRFGLYVRSKMMSVFNRNGSNSQTGNFTKLAEDNPLQDAIVQAGVLGGLKLGARAGNALVHKARLFTPMSSTIGTFGPMLVGGMLGGLATGGTMAYLDYKNKLPGVLQAPRDETHRSGIEMGGNVGILAGLARGLYAAKAMPAAGKVSQLARLSTVLNSAATGNLIGKAVGSIGGYYVSKTTGEGQTDDQSEDVDSDNPYSGQLNAS